MDYQLIRLKLDDLTDFVRSGRLALPDFQRDFVWSPPKVVDLMQSIARQWPIGSLLLLEGPADFACKPLELAPEVSGGVVRYLLLDGQQRMTSIFHTLQDLSEYVYYVDVRVLVEESLDEDFIFYMRRKSFESKYPTIESRALNRIIKISEIYETESFFNWLSGVGDADYQKAAVKIRRNYVYGLNSGVYSVPATLLPSGIRFDALAKIFEGLNTNAVRLTTSDLLVASNLTRNVNLRTMWSEYQSKDPNVEALDLDLLDVLKLCVLRERVFGEEKISGIKQTDLVKVDPVVYKRQWNIACDQLSNALSFASRHFGVKSSKLLPSSYNLLGLSFALELKMSPRAIVEWWVSVIIGETFAQSAHTRMLTEVRRLTDHSQINENSLLDYEKSQLELVTALGKPHGSNAYLARGILSLRLAITDNPAILDSEPFFIGERLKISGPSGSSASLKNVSIGSLQISESTKIRNGYSSVLSSNIRVGTITEIVDILSKKIENA